MTNVCWNINRKKGYFRIQFWNPNTERPTCIDYPLWIADELKAQHDQTWQALANDLADIVIEESIHEKRDL